MEWADYRQSLCGGCGQPKRESMDPEMARSFEAVPLTCYGCAAKDAERRKADEARSGGKFSDGAFDGVYIAVTRREG